MFLSIIVERLKLSVELYIYAPGVLIYTVWHIAVTFLVRDRVVVYCDKTDN